MKHSGSLMSRAYIYEHRFCRNPPFLLPALKRGESCVYIDRSVHFFLIFNFCVLRFQFSLYLSLCSRQPSSSPLPPSAMRKIKTRIQQHKEWRWIFLFKNPFEENHHHSNKITPTFSLFLKFKNETLFSAFLNSEINCVLFRGGGIHFIFLSFYFFLIIKIILISLISIRFSDYYFLAIV